jgi:hypothetical protein
MKTTTRTPTALAGASRATHSVSRARRYALAGLAALASVVVGGGLAAAPPAAATRPPQPPSTLTITPRHAEFATTFVGSTSDPVVFTVHNLGKATSGTLTTGIRALSKNLSFGIVSGTDTCTGTALAPSTSCSVAVVFDPVAPGPAFGQLEVGNGPENCCPPGPTAVFRGEGIGLVECVPPLCHPMG